MDEEEEEYPSSSINPVIGVILMVAITVILAAVIAILSRKYPGVGDHIEGWR